MKDVQKVWKGIKVFGENFSGSTYVTIDYKLDDDTSWTSVSGTVDTTPSEELSLGNVRGKRIKFKLTLITGTATVTPRVLATLVEAYGIVPIKHEYSWTSMMGDKYYSVDLLYRREKAMGTGDVDTVLGILDAWTNAGTPLTMNSRSKLYNNKTVVLEAVAMRPLDAPAPEQKNQQERHLVQIVCHDI